MTDFRQEDEILNRLIEVNIDASRFYGHMAKKVDGVEMRKNLFQLENLHRHVAADLCLATYQNGGATQAAREEIGIFLSPDLPVDKDWLSEVESAEAQCSNLAQEAIESNDVSNDIKVYVFGALKMLDRSATHIGSLKRGTAQMN